MQFTSNLGNGHLIRLPADSRKRLSASFLRASDRFLEAIRWCLDRGPAEGSRGSEYKTRQQQPRLGSSLTSGESIVEQVVFACRAGLDHARLVATSLPDERASFAIVTTTRGCVESFAKAWWLMDAPNQQAATTRWLSALLKELNLRHRLDPDAVLIAVDNGAERTIADYREAVARDLQSMSPDSRPVFVSDTSLASEFGDLLGPEGRRRYSLFSAVAHGESLGIGDFVGVTTGTRSPHYVVGMPAWFAEYCAETSFIASSVAMRMLFDFVGFEDPDGRVMNAHDEALLTMQAERSRNAAIVHRSMHRFA